MARSGPTGADWDSIFAIWRQAPAQSLWRRHSDAVNAGLVEAWLDGRFARILKTDLWDEAVGEGLFPSLSRHADEVVGIDASAQVVAAAARRYPTLTAVHADVRRLPFTDGYFGAVFSNSTLDHLATRADLVAAIRELRRVLAPGGTFLVSLDNPANPLVALTRVPGRLANPAWRRLGRLHRGLGLLPYRVGTTLGPRRFRRALTEEGFAVDDMRAVVHAPRALAVVLARLLERGGGRRGQERFLAALAALERLEALPTRYVTGHFVAARATRPGEPARG